MRQSLFLIFSSLGVVSGVSASVYEGPGLGARATAAGGAFVSRADDWTAIYWNPAGLTSERLTEAGGSLEFLSVRAHDSVGLRNPVAPLTSENLLRGDVLAQLGGEPSSFQATDSSFRVPLPAAGVNGQWNRLGWAVGSYAPMGFSFKISDDSRPGYAASYESQGYLLNHNVSLAYPVLPYLSLGAGVNGVQGRIEREAHKFTPLSQYESGTTLSGWGVQGVFGFLYRWRDAIRLGGVYRTGSTLKLKGRTHIADTRLPITVPGVGTIQSESSDITYDLRNPTTWGLGASWSVIPTVVFSADWQRTAWSESRLGLSFDSPGFLLQNQSMDRSWEDSDRYRFGMEWTFRPQWSVSAGYFRDPQVVPYSQQSLTNFVDVPTRYYTTGLSWDRRRWRVSVSAQYMKGSASVGTQTFKREAFNWTTQLDYRIGAR